MFKLQARFADYPHGGLERGAPTALIVIGALFLGVGGVIAAVAVYLLMELYPRAPAGVLMPIGAWLIALGVALLARLRDGPARLVFNAHARRLYLLDDPNAPLSEAPSLPYDALEGLCVKRVVSQNRGAYSLLLRVRGLGEWSLMTFSRESGAEEARLSLLALSGCPTAPPPEESARRAAAHLPRAGEARARFEVRRQGEQSVIAWRTRRPAQQTAGLAVVTLGVTCELIAAVALNGGLLPMTVLTLLGALSLRACLRQSVSRQVEVSRSAVRVSPKPSFLSAPRRAEVPTAELWGLNASLLLPRQLNLLTHDSFKLISAARQASGPVRPKDALELLKATARQVAVSGEGLSTCELLALDELLRDEVERVSGQRLS